MSSDQGVDVDAGDGGDCMHSIILSMSLSGAQKRS